MPDQPKKLLNKPTLNESKYVDALPVLNNLTPVVSQDIPIVVARVHEAVKEPAPVLEPIAQIESEPEPEPAVQPQPVSSSEREVRKGITVRYS